MSRRFFVEMPITSDSATIIGQEAQHLSKVMRAKVGDEITLFDGSGCEFLARIETVGRSEVTLAVLSSSEIDRESKCDITIGVALPKGDRQKWLVEKLVELGARKLVPIVTAHSVAQPKDKALERLRRAVVEASKQCGRNRLMQIADAMNFDEFVASADDSAVRLIAHPCADSASGYDWWANANSFVIAIGPEGGFTDEEVTASIEEGWRTVTLGERILRTETAAIASVAKIVAW